MLYLKLTCSMIPSVDLARDGVSPAKDLGIWEMCCKQLHVVVVLLFYVHGKHLRSCRDGQLT